MYLRSIRSRNLFQLSCRHVKSSLSGISQSHGDHHIQNNLIRKFSTVSLLPSRVRLGTFRNCRYYSSEGKEGSTSDVDKGKGGEEVTDSPNASGQVKKEESQSITKQDKFKNDLLRHVTPWEKSTVSWENFPYYIDEHTKTVMEECASSHLKHRKFATSYGSRLSSSSARILLQSIPGTELYRERFVSAFAHGLKVPLLVLHSSLLTPYHFGQGCAIDSEAEDESGDTHEECTSDSETEGENDTSNENASDSDDDHDVDVSAEAIKKLVPCSLEEFAKIVSEEIKNASVSAHSDVFNSVKDPKQPLKKGDRVKYVGASGYIVADNTSRPLSNGQRGEVFEVNRNQVAVVLDSTEDNTKEGNKDGNSNQDAKPSVYWFKIEDIVHECDSRTEDWYIALEALREVLSSPQPLIIYFPDSTTWVTRAVPKPYRKEFIQKVEEMFDQIEGPVVLICGQTVVETGSKGREKFTLVLPHLGRLAQLPVPLKRLTERLTAATTSDNDISKLFTNTYFLRSPKEEKVLQTFNKQIEEDRIIIISRNNLCELHEVLEENGLSCAGLVHVKTDGLILTKEKAEKVVGWAKNHYLSSSELLSIKGDRLDIPCESLDIAISRLREQEAVYMKHSLNLKSLAKDEYESNFISAVVPPDEVGVKFDDIGALEDVKKTLNELVTLPMRRPELFTHGNLLRPCKGILLFGPPGTGKTLLAKALATEAGANFISITGSTLTSKWFGDAEKLTKALFSFASRLSPVIIFVDEVDSLLGARGGAFEHEATRRMRNEFMAAWDGLRSKDSQRILILGATNRPFDLDDAVIRRLPRRIYVDLPDAENRTKILRILLSQENLEQSFRYDELSSATEGYSGSDLKNLCIAAAYRPVQELIEEEKKGEGSTPALRPLNLEDFIQAKVKVGASVAYDAASMNELRKWNEMYGEGGSRRKSPFGFGN